ncbi:MAG: hypothetical protein JRF63_01080 [Deltaproteobacteria bacterium]|nr:hypothetical protein [Deltaproteobacteria bacterium]
MTRKLTLTIAALALLFTGCQEGSGQVEAPAVEEEEAVDIEQASPHAVDSSMCDLLASKHAEQLKQTMVIYDRLSGAITAKEQDRAAQLNAKIADALAKSKRTRAEMKRQGCVDIPEPPKVEVINSPPADSK